MTSRFGFALLAIALTACASGGLPAMRLIPSERSAVPSSETLPRTNADVLAGLAAGFEIGTPAIADIAAGEGIQLALLYGGPQWSGVPSPGSPLATAFLSHHMKVIDGTISGILYAWECHRTHTVAPPPKSYAYNPYCRNDGYPGVDSEAAVLADVRKTAARDSALAYVVAYWSLDDWPWWDSGSGRALLQRIHAILAATGKPSICGFGGGVGPPGKVYWDPGTAKNFSPGGCDWVAWYNYSPFGQTHPSSGKNLDWSMRSLLPAMRASLGKYGWNMSTTPLMGVSQAWGGRYGPRDYQPGLDRTEMLTQARAFCAFGAQSIAWYSWDDSGFVKATRTPVNSAAIAAGIAAGLNACRTIWTSRGNDRTRAATIASFASRRRSTETQGSHNG